MFSIGVPGLFAAVPPDRAQTGPRRRSAVGLDGSLSRAAAELRAVGGTSASAQPLGLRGCRVPYDEFSDLRFGARRAWVWSAPLSIGRLLVFG